MIELRDHNIIIINLFKASNNIIIKNFVDNNKINEIDFILKKI